MQKWKKGSNSFQNHAEMEERIKQFAKSCRDGSKDELFAKSCRNGRKSPAVCKIMQKWKNGPTMHICNNIMKKWNCL